MPSTPFEGTAGSHSLAAADDRQRQTAGDHGRERRLYRAWSWIQRAASSRDQEDLDGRFIFYWIAFNALYGQAEYLAEDRQREEARIHDFLGKMIRLGSDRRDLCKMLTRIDSEMAMLLKNQFLCKEYWTDGFTDRLDDSLHCADEDVQAALAGVGSIGRLILRVFDRLYILRIQLFHGCSKDGSSANRDSLEPAVAVLKRLVPLFWATMKRGAAPEDWGALSYPAFGRSEHPPDTRTRCLKDRH